MKSAGHDWPAEYGPKCHECTPAQRRRAAQRKRDRESEKAPIPEAEEELGNTGTKENEDLKTPESAQEATLGHTDRDDFTWKRRLKETTKRSELDHRWKSHEYGGSIYRFRDGSSIVADNRGAWDFGDSKKDRLST